MNSNHHTEYLKHQLHRKDLKKNPFQMFKYWYDKAGKVMGTEAGSMVLSTADKHGNPHSRIVLLKHFTDDGFVFFSNYDSDKGRQLNDKPSVALLFNWSKLERQIRIEGSTEKISNSESDTYWDSRSRGSQIATFISPQSRLIPNRSFLEERFQKIASNSDMINRPANWGGYRVRAKKFEFWQGRKNRLNDRFIYRLNDQLDWDIHRLAP